MFTGLVQATGLLSQIRRRSGGLRLVVRPDGWDYRPAPGDSVAVSGCCLTVVNRVDPDRPEFHFDVVRETLAKTKLGVLRVGSRVNLEHAATVGTLLGGHVVQGHVDGVGMVAAVQQGADWRVRVAVPRPGEGRSDPSAGDLMQYIIPKGSVSVDGTSLTVASLWQNGRAGRGFEVALIPATLEKTTLAVLRRGHAVNLEVDCLAKTVVHWLRHYAGPGVAGAESGPAEAPAPVRKPARSRR